MEHSVWQNHAGSCKGVEAEHFGRAWRLRGFRQGVHRDARSRPREPGPVVRHRAQPAHDDDCRASSTRLPD